MKSFDDLLLKRTVLDESPGRTIDGDYGKRRFTRAMTSFNDLLEMHKQLDDLFLEHQRSLLRQDLMAAGDALEAYTIELLAHMQDEEEWMLPIYRERAEVPVGGTADIFLGEHDKMRQYLLLFKEELAKLAEEEDLERGVIFLLDSQHIFKRLLVHHDTRERKVLYPLLDQVTTEPERKNLFKLFRLPPVIAVAAGG